MRLFGEKEGGDRMRIYVLTSVGEALSSNPSNSGSNAMRILYYLRRHGKQASDQQLLDHLGLSGTELNAVMNDLERNSAIKTVIST